ncbi:hypothetical protein [Rubritalea tangerina]|uniref:hypothetical protein n=1 Tax=Rubritalea tangerina TaxID=430798 RepID=UPI00362086C3
MSHPARAGFPNYRLASHPIISHRPTNQILHAILGCCFLIFQSECVGELFVRSGRNHRTTLRSSIFSWEWD